MKNVEKFRGLILGVALCGVLVAPVAAEAQGRRGDTWRTGQGNVRDLVNAVERSSNAFRATVERRDGRLDDWEKDRKDDRRRNRRRENRFEDRDRFFDQVEPHVQRMDEAFERLRREVRDDRPRDGRDEMQDVLRHARQVDRFFGSSTFWRRDNNNGRLGDLYTRSGNLNSQWNRLRSDINALARYYGLPSLNGQVRRRF